MSDPILHGEVLPLAHLPSQNQSQMLNAAKGNTVAQHGQGFAVKNKNCVHIPLLPLVFGLAQGTSVCFLPLLELCKVPGAVFVCSDAQ